jgi:hypothetical protein
MEANGTDFFPLVINPWLSATWRGSLQNGGKKVKTREKLSI